MKLELNVVRFENEDVIATSCHDTVAHFDVSELCNLTTPGHDTGNGNAVLYYPCPAHEGKVMIAGGGFGFCQHESTITETGWYHIDLVHQDIIPCENGGISPDRICGSFDDAEHEAIFG